MEKGQPVWDSSKTQAKTHMIRPHQKQTSVVVNTVGTVPRKGQGHLCIRSKITSGGVMSL
jgi:hypothetical protein